MKLSIVTTMYKSGPYISEFYRRVKASAEEITNDYEIIIVNDGSPDNSLEIALEFVKSENNIQIVDLSKNFGHQKAVAAGLAYTKGEYVFLIDCDLEEPPELLKTFWHEMKASDGVDLIYGLQRQRKGNWFEKYSGRAFWWIFNKISKLEPIKNPVTVRIMTRRFVDSILLHEEKELFLAGIFQITGFNQKTIYVDKIDRQKSSYSFKAKFHLFLTGVTSFSPAPLIAMFYCGGIITLIALFYGAHIIVIKLLAIREIELGWTSIIASIWFIGGVLMMFMGIMGIYISHIYMEVKNRPRTIVREHYRRIDIARDSE